MMIWATTRTENSLSRFQKAATERRDSGDTPYRKAVSRRQKAVEGALPRRKLLDLIGR